MCNTYEQQVLCDLVQVCRGVSMFSQSSPHSAADPNWWAVSLPILQREPDREEQAEDNMPPKFKRHLNDDEVTGSIRSERVRHRWRECLGLSGDGGNKQPRIEKANVLSSEKGWTLSGTLKTTMHCFPLHGNHRSKKCLLEHFIWSVNCCKNYRRELTFEGGKNFKEEEVKKPQKLLWP